jgi:hypothetical protein
MTIYQAATWMSSCNGRLDLAMSILETLSLNDTIGNIVCAT